MDERIKMIGDYRRGVYSITELAEIYGVSRKTLYKWIGRYDQEGIEGLKERSRAPLSHPNAISEAMTKRMLQAKKKYGWGPKKIRRILQKQVPETPWPSLSTVEKIFRHHGLVQRRQKRHQTPPQNKPLLALDEPNKVWSADFKGDFLLGNGVRCYPLTISDNYSRYLLGCRGLTSTCYEDTQHWFERTFREYGLPVAIRHDNGAPFAGLGVTGLGRLSVWWLKLGILSERIERGKPHQNGRHERMHRTLKEAVVTPPSYSMRTQQQAFNKFRRQYNEVRPHEALGQEPPVSVYGPSTRAYPSRLTAPQYDEGSIVRRVRKNGYIRFKGKDWYLSESLYKESVSLVEMQADIHEIRFSVFPIALLDMRKGIIQQTARKDE